MPEITSNAFSLVTIVLMFVVLYFFMIRPQKKRDQAAKQMRDNLAVGSQITTIGGIIGRVVAVRDDQITIETGADRVKLHFQKWAIQSVDKIED